MTVAAQEVGIGPADLVGSHAGPDGGRRHLRHVHSGGHAGRLRRPHLHGDLPQTGLNGEAAAAARRRAGRALRSGGGLLVGVGVLVGALAAATGEQQGGDGGDAKLHLILPELWSLNS